MIPVATSGPYAISALSTLAAALFIALAIWSARGRVEQASVRWSLTMALLATGLWAGLTGTYVVAPAVSAMLETTRNGCWLLYMWTLSGSLGQQYFPRAVRLIYKLIAILIVSLLLLQLCEAAGLIGDARALVVQTLYGNLSLIVAAGLLVLVHNLYNIVAHGTRRAFGPTLAALTAMWAYDLNLYAIGIFAQAPADLLIALRPALSILLVPLLAFGWTQRDRTRFTVSRSVAFQSLSLFAIGAYLGAMAVIANIVRSMGGDYGRIAQQVVTVAALAALAVLVSSRASRGWLRVHVTKHFFRHRYDYRNEWMRFTQTIGHAVSGADPLQTRVIKAVADITGSPGGVLLLPDEHRVLTVDQRWHWDDFPDAAQGVPANTADYLQQCARVIEFDALREMASGTGEREKFPNWMVASRTIWIGIPLIHFGHLTGLVLLSRPRHARRLDWEDFDLLKTVAGQIASYLSEAQGQYDLLEARRFDEFNRRFAFIMHDIKNAISQLSLIARNAERHADNPEFRRDMVESLHLTVGRMNTLLARLSQHNKGKPMEPVRLTLSAIVADVAAQKRRLHPIEIGHVCAVDAYADGTRVEQILAHLVQNAIDASEPEMPVRVALREDGDRVGIDVVDRGCGMTAEFVRDSLFKAFASTKDGGFGIGAFEARSLAHTMNGRIEVESRLGKGSRFTLWLPRYAVDQPRMTLPTPQTDRTAA